MKDAPALAVVWLGSAAVVAAVPVAWWALSSGERKLSQRVGRNLAEYRPTMREAVLERSPLERFFLPLVRKVGLGLIRFTPVTWLDTKRVALARAGWTGRFTPEQILGAKLVFPALLALILTPRLVEDGSGRAVLLFLTALVAGFVAPDLLVKAKADRRSDEITTVLPDILDQLTISVEAGLGFEAALSRLSSDEEHALAIEFRRMLQDIRLGTPRGAALDALAERSQVEDLKSMVLSLRHAESLGVPLAKTLRNLSKEMREKRRYRAEERANKLPIKMIFPLGICILPALFIVILGPAVLRFFELFS